MTDNVQPHINPAPPAGADDGRHWWQKAPIEWFGGDAEAARAKLRARIERQEDRKVGLRKGWSSLAGVRLNEDSITYQGEGYPLAGLTVRVESAGELQQRITATRLVMTGPLALAWRKKKDGRELYLQIEGPDFSIVATVRPTMGAQARRFAARINTAARKLNPS